MPAALLLVFVSLVLGFVCGRLRLFPADAHETLNRFVIYVCLPALILAVVPRLVWRSDLIALAIVPWLLLAGTVPLLRWLAGRLAWSAEVTTVLLLCVPLGNTSFLGFPFVAALLGEQAVAYAAVYDQLGSFLMLMSFGLFQLARHSGVTPTPRSIARRVFSFPPFIALWLALLPLPQSETFDWVVGRLGEALVPVAMFAVGLKLELRPPRQYTALTVGLVGKLVVLPAAAWGLASLASVRPEVMQVVVLESAMPAMITAGAMAMMAGLAPELAAALVGYGILLSLGTVPAWAWLVR